MSLELIRVRRTEDHVAALYERLKARVHGISHRDLPDYAAHRTFVLKHPYRVWYLLGDGGRLVGTLYVLSSNFIGISTLPGEEGHVASALDQVIARHRPLPAIPSVRAGHYGINVAPGNATLVAELERYGARLAQVTYALP